MANHKENCGIQKKQECREICTPKSIILVEKEKIVA